MGGMFLNLRSYDMTRIGPEDLEVKDTSKPTALKGAAATSG